MARIVYGVSGEGSGHSSRARVILRHLLEQGHDVRVISYERGYRNLKDDFTVQEVAGLTIVSADNRVSPIRTILTNLKHLPDGIKSFRRTRQELFKNFQPDCVITDFEPTSAYLANYYRIPLISLDNQHRMRYMEYPRPDKFKKDAMLTEAIIRAMVPKPDVSLFISFYEGRLKNSHSFVFPPILRESVRGLQRSNQQHILVYATSGFDTLLDELRHFSHIEFKVYGYDRDVRDANLKFCPFSNDGFLQDLAGASAVIATAGFTLLTEALYLGKPYLALPMQGQFEQILNALMLEQLKYGACALNINHQVIADFLHRLEDYRENLSHYPREGNEKITAFIDGLLENDCSRLREFQRLRGL